MTPPTQGSALIEHSLDGGLLGWHPHALTPLLEKIDWKPMVLEPRLIMPGELESPWLHNGFERVQWRWDRLQGVSAQLEHSDRHLSFQPGVEPYFQWQGEHPAEEIEIRADEGAHGSAWGWKLARPSGVVFRLRARDIAVELPDWMDFSDARLIHLRRSGARRGDFTIVGPPLPLGQSTLSFQPEPGETTIAIVKRGTHRQRLIGARVYDGHLRTLNTLERRQLRMFIETRGTKSLRQIELEAWPSRSRDQLAGVIQQIDHYRHLLRLRPNEPVGLLLKNITLYFRATLFAMISARDRPLDEKALTTLMSRPLDKAIEALAPGELAQYE